MDNYKDISFTSVLAGINQNSCPKHINLHCHTIYSDGSLQPIELFKQASSNGLRHLAITDHHSVSAYYEINKFIITSSDLNVIPKIWSGIEITCLIKGCLVHVLGFDFDVTAESMRPYIQGESQNGSYLRAENVIKAIHEANGISSLAHPARYRLSFKDLITEAANIGIDAIEVWYDYNFSKKWVPSKFVCSKIDDFVKKLGLYSTCGTDTHGLSILCR